MYSNEASIEAEGAGPAETSNKVEVEVPANPTFTIEKLQKIARRSELHEVEADRQGSRPTVDYEIVVKNTGNTSLKFEPLSDPGCTSISPSGEVTLARAANRPTRAATN